MEINLFNKLKNKLFSDLNNEKSIYSDLVPIDSLDSEAESLKALHWAISNPKIKILL